MRPPRLEQPLLPLETGSLAVFGSLIFLLSVRLDGWGKPVGSVAPQLVLLPLTILFVALITAACLGRTEHLLLPLHWRKMLARISLFGLGLSLAILFQCMSIALFVVEAFYFRRQGYVFSLPWLLTVIALSGLAFTFAALSPTPVRAGRLLLASGFIFTTGVVFSIACFPLTPMRSDMLPLIAAADARFLSGHFPYIIYSIWNGTDYLTYLPLTWMAYIPASILHMDLRWVNVIFSLSAAAITYFSVRVQNRLYAACLLSLFLLLPYVQFRHELYSSLQWLVFAVAFSLCQRRRWLAASVALGCGAATSQLFWIMLPFYLLFVLVKQGWRRCALALALIVAAAAVWILPFLLASPRQFLLGVLGHWATVPWRGHYLAIRPYNASFWISVALVHLGVGSYRNLERVQAAALLLLFLAALRYRPQGQADLWRWATAAITLFSLTNFLVWPYFYVTAFFTLILSFLCAAEDRATTDGLAQKTAMGERAEPQLRRPWNQSLRSGGPQLIKV